MSFRRRAVPLSKPSQALKPPMHNGLNVRFTLIKFRYFFSSFVDHVGSTSVQKKLLLKTSAAKCLAFSKHLIVAQLVVNPSSDDLFDAVWNDTDVMELAIKIKIDPRT
jgi:hypothetical protein